MSLSVTRWTADEEQAIARIMAAESLTRIEAIQAMQRRKRAAQSTSRRLKLRDPFDSHAHCQKRRCLDCALKLGESDPEMTAFLDLMMNGTKRSGPYFIVERDPNAEMVVGSTVFRGLYPVSARMDANDLPVSRSVREVNGGVSEQEYGQDSDSLTLDESETLRPDANMGANVDGLIPGSQDLNPEDHTASENPLEPNKALRGRGRPMVPESQKRLSAAARQARWREKQRVG